MRAPIQLACPPWSLAVTALPNRPQCLRKPAGAALCQGARSSQPGTSAWLLPFPPLRADRLLARSERSLAFLSLPMSHGKMNLPAKGPEACGLISWTPRGQSWGGQCHSRVSRLRRDLVRRTSGPRRHSRHGWAGIKLAPPVRKHQTVKPGWLSVALGAGARPS